MCGIAIILSVVLLPLASLGLLYVEKECRSVIEQRRDFLRHLDEMEAIMERVRSNYDLIEPVRRCQESANNR